MKIKYWAIIGFVILIASFALWAGYKEYRVYKEQRAIIDKQLEIQADLEKETEILGRERDILLQEKFAAEKRRALLEAEREHLSRRLHELEIRFSTITIPDDINRIAEEFKKRGFNPIIRPTR